MALAAVLFCVVIAAAIVWWRSEDSDPAVTAVDFLTATSCQDLRALADPEGRQELQEQECRNLTDAAQGMRTYTDPDLRTAQRGRLVKAGEPEVDDDHAEVTVTVSYAADNGALPEEKVAVVLVHDDDRWLVQSWGVEK